MSKELSTRTFLIATDIGNIVVDERLVLDYDPEDIIRDKAVSQARYMQMQNVAYDLDKNAQLPSGVVQTQFKKEA